MAYNPFARGSAPVGVRTIQLCDENRQNRTLVVELWYPATEAYRGLDLDDASRDRFSYAPGFPETVQSVVRDAEAAWGIFPLLICSHGAGSHRRASSGLCSHLASHGYIIAAPDFPGDSLNDLSQDYAAGSGARTTSQPLDVLAQIRPQDVAFVLDRLLAGGEPSLHGRIDAERIGTFGGSYGGWTSLALNALDSRPRATFAACPPWGAHSPLPQIRRLGELLPRNDWGRPVPTFLLTGDRDSIVIVDDMRQLYRELPTPKRFAVLSRAGHMHWVDNAEVLHESFRAMYLSGKYPDPEFDAVALAEAMGPFSELCSAWHASDTVQGLCLAHMDAYLKDDQDALAFLDTDLANTFAARGISLEVAAPVHAPTVAEKQQNDASKHANTTTWETFQIESNQLVEQVKQLIHEGNVRRIVVKQDDHTIVEFPLTVGVIGAFLAAPLAALGALAALLNDCTIEVERESGATSVPTAQMNDSHPERMVATNGVTICTQAFGDPANPAVLMIMGANASMLGWPAELCQQIADGGRYVIRFDNRDMGRSTTYPPYEPPYTLEDLARDAVGILDAYGIERAHAVGISSGGMIAQLLAIHHADRISSITAICSSPDPKAIIAALRGETGEGTLPAPTPAVLNLIAMLAKVDWSDEAAAVEAFIEEGRVVAGSTYPFDEAWYRAYAAQEYRRTSNILSMRFNHAIAEGNTPRWRNQLHRIEVSTLVIHGTEDPALPFAHGVALAKDIPGATFLALDGVGHIVLKGAWPLLVPALLNHTADQEVAMASIVDKQVAPLV